MLYYSDTLMFSLIFQHCCFSFVCHVVCSLAFVCQEIKGLLTYLLCAHVSRPLLKLLYSTVLVAYVVSSLNDCSSYTYNR